MRNIAIKFGSQVSRLAENHASMKAKNETTDPAIPTALKWYLVTIVYNLLLTILNLLQNSTIYLISLIQVTCYHK